MKTGKEVLSSALKTTQMGQIGIRSVLDTTMKPQLRQALEDQLKEYDALEKQTLQLAKQYGLKLHDLNPALETMSNMLSKAQLIGGETDSKIAGMLIQGNTRGMILGLKNLRKASGTSPAVKDLAKKLLNRENINIQKSQQFL
jgi:spore coat protein CotF